MAVSINWGSDQQEGHGAPFRAAGLGLVPVSIN